MAAGIVTLFTSIAVPRLAGCDQMECGRHAHSQALHQEGCGHVFSWQREAAPYRPNLAEEQRPAGFTALRLVANIAIIDTIDHGVLGHLKTPHPPVRGLSGPVLRGTARLSHQYLPIARNGVWVSQHDQFGAGGGGQGFRAHV